MLELEKKYPHIPIVSHVWNMHNWEEYQDAILVGFHAMNGISTRYAHTLRPEIQCIKLGNKKIGEIEWLINTASFYGMRVKGVLGEDGARNECDKIGIPFWATDKREKNTFGEMAHNIKKMLEMDNSRDYIYNEREIKIVFKNSAYLEYIPKDMFKIGDNNITFKNTIEMNEQIYGLCQFLNAGETYKKELIRRASNITKKFYSKKEVIEISDKKFNEIILKREVREISINDLLYICDILYKWKDRK